VVLQGKVTKLKREVRHFDEALKSIQPAMINFLNEEPTKAQQFQINGGLVTLKSSVDDMLGAMKGVSLRMMTRTTRKTARKMTRKVMRKTIRKTRRKARTSEQLSRRVSAL
jgi:hypothetical protein